MINFFDIPTPRKNQLASFRTGNDSTQNIKKIALCQINSQPMAHISSTIRMVPADASHLSSMYSNGWNVGPCIPMQKCPCHIFLQRSNKTAPKRFRNSKYIRYHSHFHRRSSPWIPNRLPREIATTSIPKSHHTSTLQKSHAPITISWVTSPMERLPYPWMGGFTECVW